MHRFFTLCLFGLAVTPVGAVVAKDRPNILFIYTND